MTVTKAIQAHKALMNSFKFEVNDLLREEIQENGDRIYSFRVNMEILNTEELRFKIQDFLNGNNPTQ